MYNHLYDGGIKVKGDSSRDCSKILPYLSIKLGGEEVLHQSQRDMTSVTTSLSACNLNG
jgi:hypothetical protein